MGMTPSHLSSLFRGALASQDADARRSDEALLSSFAANGDEAAFVAILKRHGPLVWSLCRNLLPNEADAEDAFQASMLVLVRSAKTIRKGTSLAGWLHGVTYRVCMKARRSAVRKRQRDAKVARPEGSAVAPTTERMWDDIHAVVHDEVERLPETMRHAFILCSLQGHSMKEAARILGWKVGTVTSQLSRARQQLMAQIEKRNLPLAVGVATASLGVAGASVPRELFSKTAGLAKPSVSISPSISTLARGANPMFSRTKIAVTGLLAASLLTVGIGLLPVAGGQEAPVKKPIKVLVALDKKSPKWEYLFEPQPKAVDAEDFRKKLETMEKDRWEFCGSQPMTSKNSKEPTEHLVFKRLRTNLVEQEVAIDARLETLKELRIGEELKKFEQEKAILLKQRFLEEMKRKMQAEDERAIVLVEQARLQAEKDKQAEESVKAGLRYLETASKFKTTEEQLKAEIAQLEKMLRELKAKTDMDKERSVLEKRFIEVEVKTTEAKPDVFVAKLKFASAAEVAQILQKVFDTSKGKISVDQAVNSLIVAGKPEFLEAVKAVIEKLDTKSTKPAAVEKEKK
jgi:RNA polymerase sigma factor (sigma-70 family)